MRKQVSEQLVRGADQAASAGEHLAVGEVRKVIAIERRVTKGNGRERHRSSVHLAFSCSQKSRARDSSHQVSHRIILSVRARTAAPLSSSAKAFRVEVSRRRALVKKSCLLKSDDQRRDAR